MDKLNAHATLPSEEHPYTVRKCFEDYRDNGGSCWVNADPPELSVGSETGEITCMANTQSPIGMPRNGLYIGLLPQFHDTPEQVAQSVSAWVSGALEAGDLWCYPGSVRATRSGAGTWKLQQRALPKEVSTCIQTVEECAFHPLAISTVHAAMEADKVRHHETFRDYYPFPRTTAFSTGLFGTSHNNSFIDMSPAEEEKNPDVEARSFKPEYVGYVCASHTSHSYEAGRSRRVTLDVQVRTCSELVLEQLQRISQRGAYNLEGEKDWTLWCCGQFCRVTWNFVKQLCTLHKLSSIGKDPGYGVYIRLSVKVCVVCVSPGVLTKKCSNGVWADNCNAYASDTTEQSLVVKIDTSGRDFHRSCLSGHYSYIPFVEHDAAVRTSISSAQVTQAICLPFCPATAAVSPCYVFSPIVTTPTYKRIMIRQSSEFDASSYLPGENVCILYMNVPLNYEDALVVSKTYVDNGGFSTMSTCRYLLPPRDYVPPVGARMCSVLCDWWKSGCQRYCRHTVADIASVRRYSPFSCPTGTVLSRTLSATGEQHVKVRSYAAYQPGDKLSTGHGQKGVGSVLVSREDMPVCVGDNGENIIPDVIMAVGSVTSRQTTGQVYESAAGVNRLRDLSAPAVVQVDEVPSKITDVRVLNPYTGAPCTTIVADLHNTAEEPHLKQTRATVGYVRMFNQSQMTRERHFTSHRTMTVHSLRTPTRRSRGGAVREGEMEVQATVAAGLVHCTDELRKRGDEVVVHLCTQCQRLRLLHSCTDVSSFIEITLPYDTVVLDCVNKITYNCVFEYEVELDI